MRQSFSKYSKLVITEKSPVQVCNDSTLQRQDQESYHKEDDVIIIRHLTPIASAADDSHIEVICDYTDVFMLLLYFCMGEKMTVKTKTAWNA